MCNHKLENINGIQITQKHRIVVQADTPVRYRPPLAVRRGDGVERVEPVSYTHLHSQLCMTTIKEMNMKE